MSADVRTISYTALARARTTLEDFVLSYFPLHGLAAEDFFKHSDLLVYLEASIYQLDEENEGLAAQGALQAGAGFAEREGALLGVLRAKGLASAALCDELAQGRLYWQRERELARQLLQEPETARPGLLEEVLATSAAKSFDYRALHHLLHGLLGKEPDPALLAFLRLDEQLVDIGDDLLDYEEDVERNSFNVYRGFVRCLGREAPLALAGRISALEQGRAEALARLPADTQAHVARRHRQAALAPGAGNWVIPNPILDEEAFRRSCADAG